MTLFDDPLAAESIEANKEKKNKGINIVVGNPPYSGISSNSGEWITRLIEDYKYINGIHFRERKHWLQDDYVKFIRFSERIIEHSSNGILAFINNHGFIDNPTFRCMRWHLLNTFDEVYILNLHGNVMRRETSPDGGKDENVFDIQQGVSINIFIKYGGKSYSQAKVFYADCYGRREAKYDYLYQTSFKKIPWERISPSDPFYLFIPRNENNREKYELGFSLQELFPKHTTGVVTARDNLVISRSYAQLIAKIEDFADVRKSDDEIRSQFFGNKKAGKYEPGDSRGWSLPKARRVIRNEDHQSRIQKIAYRPFDEQFIYYSSSMVDWGRENLMRHMLIGENYGLIIPRQAATDNWSHVQITKYMADNRVHYSNKGISIECPLYLYSVELDGKLTRTRYLNMDITNSIAKAICETFLDERRKAEEQGFTSLDLLDYIYAVLHSERFRKVYLELLKFDFPRIPYPTDKEIFWKMVSFGSKLRQTHLLETSVFNEIDAESITANIYPVEKADYCNGCVFVNAVECFHNVPKLAWNFYFGGYQPAQKWIKDRKSTILSAEEIKHYYKIIRALVETDRIMKEIDEVFVF